MKKKLKILAVVNNLGAVAQVRIISPLKFLKENGYVDYEVIDVSLGKENPITYVPDIVILQRLNDMNYYEFFKFLKSKGSKIIFELDDNLLELPKKNPAYSLFSDPNLKRGFLEYIWLADYLMVSTENLKNYYSEFNKQIVVVPNQIDDQIFSNQKIRKTDISNIRIGFAGTITHREDFEQVEPALREIQTKYKNRIKLVFLNMIPKTFVHDRSVEFIPGADSLKEFSERLLKANFDIGLAPLSFNNFNMGKSDIKFLEYGITGVAGVYSNFGPYKRTIANNETGLLVNLEGSVGWLRQLSWLIENPSEIDRIKENSFNYVSERRTLKNNYESWLNAFSQISQIKVAPKNKIISKHKKTSNSSIDVSIICLTYNQLKFTKEFIDSVQKHTSNYELIAVDNNSTDGTKKYLIELAAKQDNVKIILNDENLGFPKSVNQALKVAKRKYVVLANNDIVVTKNWLNRLIDVAKTDDKIGIVGPISNSVSGLQIDKGAKYSTMDEMHIYAKQISEKNKNQISEFPRLAFLCTLIKKEVIEKIGGLDERFSPGNFEDDDFCLRSQLSGYKAVIAKDVFIHHYGSVSFKQNGQEEYDKRIKINEQKFINKWNANPEEIWLDGNKIKIREIKIPINKDLFIQSIERAFIDIDEKEYDFTIENLKLALEHYDDSERLGYENITKEELLNIAGNISLTKNQLEEAKDYFEQELNSNPNSSTACFGLGEVFYNAEMIEQSKSMYEWAVVNDTANQNAKIRLHEVNVKLELPEEHNSILTESEEGVR